MKYLMVTAGIIAILAGLFLYNSNDKNNAEKRGYKSGYEKAKSECKDQDIKQQNKVIQKKQGVIQIKSSQQNINNQPTDLEYRLEWLRLLEQTRAENNN